MFIKQQEIPKFHIVVDDAVNSDWITTSYDSSIPKPDLGLRSNMEALRVPFPWEEEETERRSCRRRERRERGRWESQPIATNESCFEHNK